jgi:peptidoglycan/LPS O-acetylase OafA/YrhL
MNYRREIDGLRAIAVLPVIFFHAGFQTFSGGFVGVDVFFVISGFLITSIILADLENGRFSILDFYERRARRILPALFLVMLVCIPLAWALLLPGDLTGFARSLVAASLFVSNVQFWRESGYFDTAAELKPLLHTWSLSVEEQYYVLFPLFMMLIWHQARRWLPLILVLLVVLGLAMAQVAVLEAPAAAFYMLPTRGWELLLGACAALYSARQHPGVEVSGRWWHGAAAGLGLLLIAYAVFAFDKTTPFPGVYALVPTAGALLVILFASDKTLVGRLVGSRILVGLGLISYSAYLWHQPLFAFARHMGMAGHETAIFAALSALTLMLAYLSWRWVETLFRDRRRVSRRQIFAGSVGGSCLLIALGLIGFLNEERLSALRFDERQLQTLATAAASPKRDECQLPQQVESLGKPPCRYFNENARVAVVGNSHSTELAYSLAKVLQDRNVGIVQHTMSGCNHNYNIESQINGVCGRWHGQVVASLTADPEIEVVVLSYRHEGYLDDPAYRRALADMANHLAAAGKRVVLVLQAPMPLRHVNEYFRAHMADLSAPIPSQPWLDWQTRYAKSQHLLALLQLLRPEVAVFDPAEWLCAPETCVVIRQGTAMYFDDNHLSLAATDRLAEVLVARHMSHW